MICFRYHNLNVNIIGFVRKMLNRLAYNLLHVRKLKKHTLLYLQIHLDLTSLIDWENRAPTSDTVGCPYCWCLDIPQMTVVQFMIGFAIVVIGYPFCIAISGSLFSKIVGKHAQVPKIFQ